MHAPLALALLALVPQSGDRVPGDPDTRLDQALRSELAAVDPAAAGWRSEVRGTAAQAQLHRLTELARGGDPAAFEELVTEGFACTSLLPPDDEGAIQAVSMGEESITVRRVSPPEEPELLRGAAGLAGELERLFDALWWPSFKTVGVTQQADGFETEVLVESLRKSGGPSIPTRSEQLRASWTCLWKERPGAPPLLDRITLQSFEVVEVPRDLFKDRTTAVLGADAAAWNQGMNHWRARLDTRLGVPLLGAPAGIALADVDGDGLEDVYLCQPGGLPNRLLLHQPDHTLRDASAGSGTNFLDFSRSALLIDLDGDGDRDLVVAVVDALVFLENDGQAQFVRRASLSAPQTTSLAAADFDLDGDLDVYACAYFTPYDGDAVPMPYHDASNGQPNLMLENRGDWAFADVTAAIGMDAKSRHFSFAAAWEDFDLDGDPDLYVANDFGRNALYRNDGGRFVEVAAEAGVEDIAAGMGVSWGDVDADGDFDLYVSNMYSAAGNRVVYQRRFRAGAAPEVLEAYRRHARGNSLFENQGDGTFVDRSQEAGVTMGRWAWGARFVDLNGDGLLDVLSPNGFLTNAEPDDL